MVFEADLFKINRVAIVRSDLKPSGPEYTVIDYVEMEDYAYHYRDQCV